MTLRQPNEREDRICEALSDLARLIDSENWLAGVNPEDILLGAFTDAKLAGSRHGAPDGGSYWFRSNEQAAALAVAALKGEVP